MSIQQFADRLLETLPMIMREFTRRQANEVSKGKITLPQMVVLEYLESKKEAKMTDLARFMRVTTAAMTGIVERLVRDGYVARVFDVADRRIIRVRLTARGMEVIKKINSHRRSMIINIFEKISMQDREDYLRVLGHIKGVLEQQENNFRK